MARDKQLEYTDETCAAAIELVKSSCDFYEASDEEIAELKALWQPIVEEYVSSKWIDAIAEFREQTNKMDWISAGRMWASRQISPKHTEGVKLCGRDFLLSTKK